MRWSITRRTAAAALIASMGAACAETAPKDDPLPSQLDRLRVLAIAAEPPDIAAGEDIALDALVFEPGSRPIEYAWSWCPLSIELENGPSCPIDEELWAELWTTAGLAGAPPAFDLGSEKTASLEAGFTEEAASMLCRAISELGAAAEPARMACVDGFEASVILRARAGGDEEIAIKTVPFVPAGTPAEARNHNPGPLGEVSVHAIGSNEPSLERNLRAGHNYALRVELEETLSEALPEAETERETLVLSWFVRPGKLSSLDGGDPSPGPFDDDTQRTVYVPGRSAFETLLENGWELGQSDLREAELVLVLRDGRGGVAWRRDRFELSSGER